MKNALMAVGVARMVVIGAVLVAGGCNTATQTSATKREPVTRTGAASSTFTAPAAPVRAARHHISGEVRPLKVHNTGTVDGRALTLMYGVSDYIEGGGGAAYNNQKVYELVDAGGKVVLPLSVDDVRLVPGRGVYVLPAEDRLRHRGAAFKAALNTGLRGSETYQEPRGEGTFADLPIRYWQKYDPATGKLAPTAILHIEPAYGDRAADTTLPEILRMPSFLIVYWQGQLNAEIISPAGDLLGEYKRYSPPLGVHWLLGGGRFSVLRYWRGNEAFNQLLGRLLEPLETPVTQIVEVETVRRQRFLVTPAPGTGPQEDLWLVLQPDGRCLAPPGAIGLRP
ncbi:MAG: hypothetical protein ABW223_10665, partial [Rariglobus sp.]